MAHSFPQQRIVIVGGGSAGLTVAARLRRAGAPDVTLIDPATTHYYQPLWTLVGGGQADQRSTARREQDLIPRGVEWIREAATGFDPEAGALTTESGRAVSYDALVVAPGLQLDFGRVPGLTEALAMAPVSSNYRADLAPRTWELIRNLRSGTAVFSQPSGPIKCAGAPQKIAYLAADYWRKQGVLDDIRIVLAIPDPAMFKVPVWAAQLEKIAARYGIEVRLRSELATVDGSARTAEIVDNTSGTKESLSFDLVHAVPPQSAPDVIKNSRLAGPDNAFGYVDVDQYSLRHKRFPNVFALGDVADLPTSKTGAAIRKQAPVVVENLRAVLSGKPPEARYDGYTSCPLVTARDKMLLAEFDYQLNPTPTIPFVDTTKERRDMWLLKRYGLPALYWHGMLTGRF
ncbi:NAD(P)/FAD-dependent oxidoreductase [Amycolatopsis alkalitolerans]|uniref:NAD(P)/FAD-dependent oxidoreductase n=1 Tax=Amycolatopsis alkalitolerans TaxID=2547244 RepID=A0A5C4M9P9_9PSEU|nr:FAD/NAD(P)-binding oxidoreductase [Amycolatopsis alkalitolerans]TNC29654.1 NAD(P)/FAD-dependent oxidoreductase [Amycolatopsis alkalitolerans]